MTSRSLNPPAKSFIGQVRYSGPDDWTGSMLVSIKDFVVTGHFGPVRIGMNTTEVTTLLGMADDAGNFSGGNSGLIYGGYEFFFFDDALNAIQNDGVDFRHPDSVEPWILAGNRGTKFDEIMSACNEDGVECEVIEYFGRPALRAKSGVVLDFGEPEDNGTLIAIRFFPCDWTGGCDTG
jgi:hypothetical protein